MLAVETAKAVVEVPSPFSGTIKVLHGNPGDTVAVDAPLVEFELEGAQAGATATAPSAGAKAPAKAKAHAPATGTGTGKSHDSGTVVGMLPTTVPES